MSQQATPTRAQTVHISGEDGIVEARQLARTLARDLGFGMVDQSRIATAVSEITRNVVRYATGGRGDVLLRELRPEPGAVGLEVVVRDQGPGIENVEQALTEGFTSGPGLGMGLSGARRLVDDFEIDSELGRGTTVTLRKWRR